MVKDITGTSGRLDIIFRCLLATFSYGYQNKFFHSVLNGPPNPPKSLEVNGNKVKDLPIDEIGLANLFRILLDPEITQQYEGISLANKSFLAYASELAQLGPLFLLQENSEVFNCYLSDLSTKKDKIDSLTFILSDHLDLTTQEHAFLIDKLGATPISLGSKSYLASHCIVFVLMELKNYGFLMR